MKNLFVPIDIRGPLIASKTRLKLVLRFFLNHNLSGYLQGLSKELDEDINSKRVELNRLEELTRKTIKAQLRTEMAPEQLEQCLLVWAQQTHEE